MIIHDDEVHEDGFSGINWKDIYGGLTGGSWDAWSGATAGTLEALTANPVVGILGGPFGALSMVIQDMIGSIFNVQPTCQDPATGKILKGVSACNALQWRLKCSNPDTHDASCGKDLYDPNRINCPARSHSSGISPVGVPTGRCVCDLGVTSKLDALHIGCDLSPVWKYAPVALIIGGIVLTVRSS